MVGNNDTLYERIGGQAAVTELANKFYDVMQKDEYARKLLDMHPVDLTRSRMRLAHFLCEWLGGPKLFGERYVNPGWLKLRHRHLNIGIEDRDQWLHCMIKAMQQLRYDNQLQNELAREFYTLAGFMRTRV